MEDSAIVQMYWNRDEKAIAATSEKYGPYCSTIAMNILGNEEDAEECVNDAYLSAWNSIPPHKPKQLSTFIGKIVRNLSITLYRKNKAKKRGSGQTAVVLDELAELISDKNSPEELLDTKLLAKCINEFLSTLPAKKRIIFVCRYWYADSVKDIADRCGMTEGNVSVSLNRLRTKLHRFLLESGFEL